MKIDKLFNSVCDANENTTTHTVGRGKLNGILLVGSGTGSETITIRLRTNSQVIPICNNLKVDFINMLTDLKMGTRGIRTIGQLFEMVADDLDQLDAESSTQKSVDSTWHYRNWAKKFPSAVYLDFGHVSMGEDAELEIIHRSPAAATLPAYTVQVFGVHDKDTPDILKLYDETQDFDTHQAMVRECYLFAKDGAFVTAEGVYSDIDLQIDGDRGTILVNATGLLAATNIFNNVEALPVDSILQVFTDVEPVPGKYRVKVTGDGLDRVKHTLIFIKEFIPAQSSGSTARNLEDAIKRISSLERENSELAKRYRHVGLTEKSDDLKEVKEGIEAANARDAKGGL